MSTTVYTLKDFEDIIWTNNDKTLDSNQVFQLPKEILDLITSLTEQVSSPNYVKTPAFVKEGNRNSQNSDKPSNYKKK